MKWISVPFMWLSAAAVAIGSAMILGPAGRVAVAWISLGAFAAAVIGTSFVADSSD